MSEPLILSQRQDHAAARALWSALMERRGQPLHVDGQSVVFCGGLTAQILLATARDSRQQGVEFKLILSAAMRDDLERLGVLTEILQEEPKP